MKLIIDTDMGIDDAVALLMVLAHPQAEIKGITSVVGNIPLTQATHNAGVVLDVTEAPPVPIFQGCGRPLLRYESDRAVNIHGPDGLGGASRVETKRTAEAEHASLALIRLARQNPRKLTLLTLGPLTNVALAIRLDPDFPKNLKQMVVMGGAVDARGNTTAPTEFNVGIDPEAAKIVLEAGRDVPHGVWLLPWETSLTYATPFDVWERIIEGNCPTARFVRQMTAHIRRVMEAYDYPALVWPDPLAAAVALAPEIVSRQEDRLVEIEINSGVARGQTIVDYRLDGRLTPNVHVVREVDRDKFYDLLQQGVKFMRE